MLKVVLARQPCRLGLGAVSRGAYLRGQGRQGRRSTHAQRG